MDPTTFHGADENMEIISTIGINIMKLRKQAGLTQMGLAETMGVSFQAVSNWERGICCPDIEKLTELARLFHVSMDELVGNKKTLSAIDSVCSRDTAVTPEEIRNAAPLLTQQQADKAAEKCNFSAKDLAKVAPYVSQSFIDTFAENAVAESGSLESIREVVPFISDSLLDKLADEAYATTQDLRSVSMVLPFLSNPKVEELTRAAYQKGGIPAIKHAAPFVRTAVIDELAIDALNKHGIGGLSPVLPFISSYILEEYLKSGGKGPINKP